jgi:hypothetical protein
MLIGLIIVSHGIFLYIFNHDFAKIYGPPKILQNYTSATVAHGVRDITPRPTAVGADSSGPVVLPPWVTALNRYPSSGSYIEAPPAIMLNTLTKMTRRGDTPVVRGRRRSRGRGRTRTWRLTAFQRLGFASNAR